MLCKIPFVAVVAFFSIFAQGNAGDGSKMKMQCDGQDMKQMSPEVIEAKKACYTQYAPAGETDKKKIWEALSSNQCYSVCNYQAKGALDSTGKFNETGALEAANNFYPTEALAKQMIDGVKKCAEDAGIVSTPLSMDNNCAAFKDVNTCVHKQHMAVCKIQNMNEAIKTE